MRPPLLILCAGVLTLGTPALAEDPASAGPLDLTRRIVAQASRPGEAVAGYLRIRNGAPVTDQLISVSCACAGRIEFHQIRRGPDGASMDTDPVWDVPGHGTLDIRPGSDLHLMLLNFDASAVRDGAVRLTLVFREAGEVTADFAVAADTRAAWAAFDPAAEAATSVAADTASIARPAAPNRSLNHAGFSYVLPGSGWRTTDRTRTDTVETIYHERGFGRRSLQIQVSALTPMRPITNQAEVNEWARGAMSATTSRAVEGHGAICARSGHRWTQTTSFNGAAGTPSAEFDDHGLFCAIPGSDRVFHVRLFERAAPGRLSGEAATLAETLFASVRHSGD